MKKKNDKVIFEEEPRHIKTLKAQLHELGVVSIDDLDYEELKKRYQDELDRQWHERAAAGKLIRRKKKQH